MTVLKSLGLGLIGVVLGSLLFSLAWSIDEWDPPPYAFALSLLGLLLFLLSLVVFWLILPGLVLEQRWWRTGSYARRFVQIEAPCAVAFSTLVGIAFVIFELLDVYPFAVSQGFRRGMGNVLIATLFGAVLGLMLGLVAFLASLGVKHAPK